MKPRSFEVTDGFERAPARAMLRAVGMTDDDWDKPQIGVASSWNEVTPCNLPLDRLAKRAKEGVRAAGGFPFEFNTIAVSDGISMGHEGMRASLVSREVIADSVETVMHAERFDGLVTFAGCDKSLPGMLMAAARLNLPAVFLYGGSILPGQRNGVALDVVSVFEAVGACAAGTLTENELGEIERQACPTEGSCAGMFTANTMASVGEALGMSLPGSASAPAVDRRRDDFAYATGQAVIRLLEMGLRPRQIMTKEAFENAIAVIMALGGSTNAVLHLLAIANEARVDLQLDDFNKIAKRVPHIADTKPHGKYHMIDIDRIGGIPVVMRELLDAGLLHGDCLTVTGQDGGREPGRHRPARARRRRHPRPRRSHPRRGRHRRAHRLAGPEGLGGEGGRHRHRPLRGRGPRLRRRGRRHGGDPGRQDQRRRRGRHPLRGPEGRPGHARDAGRHRGHEGRRAGRRRRARSPTAASRGARTGSASATWPPRRSTAARSPSWPTATASSSTSSTTASTCWSTRPSWRRAERTGSCRSPATPRACWPSTPALAQGAERGAITEA